MQLTVYAGWPKLCTAVSAGFHILPPGGGQAQHMLASIASAAWKHVVLEPGQARSPGQAARAMHRPPALLAHGALSSTSPGLSQTISYCDCYGGLPDLIVPDVLIAPAFYRVGPARPRAGLGPWALCCALCAQALVDSPMRHVASFIKAPVHFLPAFLSAGSSDPSAPTWPRMAQSQQRCSDPGAGTCSSQQHSAA